MLIARLTFTTDIRHDQYIGEKGYLELTDKIEWNGGAFKRVESSSITRYELMESNIRIETLDAVYIFEILSGTFDHKPIVLADPKSIKKSRKRQEAKVHSFHCIGSPITSDMRRKSIVSFTQRMNLNEAREYIQNTMVFSNRGDLVLELLEAIIPKKI